jgi:hypothetical protein
MRNEKESYQALLEWTVQFPGHRRGKIQAEYVDITTLISSVSMHISFIDQMPSKG